MSSPFYFQEGDDSPRPLAPNPVTPFASTSAAAASSHHQHLLQSVHREGRRLRTTTADSTLSQDSIQPSPFSTQTPYLYKHTNQTPRGYDPTTRPSTAPPTDSTSINTPSSFTPFLPNRNHPSAPIFDPSSPFSQPHDFGAASSSKSGGPATDSFRSGGANMRARLFKEGASGAGAPAAGVVETPMSSPGGLGAGLFTSGAAGGGGGLSANSLGKQRQRTSSRPLDEEMHVHSSPVRVVDPREFQGGNRRSRNVGGGFGGGGDDEDEEEEEDMGRELAEAEMSFVGFGVSPVKHPSIGRGETGDWSSMGGGEETSFGGEESRMFWDEMAASESVELPFGSVRAERGRGRNMSNEKAPMGVDETEEDREDEKSRREREGSTTATTGPPPPTTMHVRNRSDDTIQMGSSPTRGPLRHQRSFHTRVRSDETSSFYQSFESAVAGAEGNDQQQPSTPPSYFVPTLTTTHEPPHTSSNLSPRRQQQQQQHHQARDIPSPIAPNPNWTFPSDILAAGAGGFSREDQDDSGAYDQQQEEQQQQELDPSRRPSSSYADQLFSQQQYQFQQQQPPQQQYDQQQYGGLETPELEQEGDNTPILEHHADRSPTFSPQIGTPDATFENSFASEGQQQQQQQQHQQQQFPPQDQQQQQFETQQPQQQQQSLYHPVHPYPGFGFAPQQQVEQQEVFIHSGPQYIFSPTIQQQHQFVPAPAPPLPALDESSSSQQQLFVPRQQQQQQHQDQVQVPSTFQGRPSSFRNHRRIGSFDADTSPHIGYSPQLDQSPMFPGQPFVGAGGAGGTGAGGGEDFGLTDLLRQARVHQNESMYHHPMGLIPEQQVEEANEEGAYGLGDGESVFDGNNAASGTSSTGSAQQQRRTAYAPFPHQVEHQVRPFPSVLAPAGSNQGIGLLPAQNFPAGFHPSTSHLPQQQQAPVLPPSTTSLPINSSRLPASFTSTTGPMANRPPNAIVGRRPIVPVIPVGHDPSFNTFERGPRVAPLLDDSSYPAATLPSSGKAPSSKSSGERQVPRGFPLVIGPGTRLRPGPKAKPKGAKSSAASRMRVASEIRMGSMETEESSASPFSINANALAGPSSAPASGLSLQQQQQIPPPRPSSSLSSNNNNSNHYHHPPLVTTALLQQHQQSFAGPSLPVLKPRSHRSASSHIGGEGEEEIDPSTHYSPDNDNSDEEGSVNSANNRPNITSALIESLFTTIRVASTSNTKRASAGSAGGSGGEDFGGDRGEGSGGGEGGMGGGEGGGGGLRRKRGKLEVRYRCLVAGCERYFPRKSAIVNHIQTHLEDKPFNCPAEGCDASFVRQHDLRRHERIHSGTKPFPCACGKGFARGDALMRHRQRGICAGSIVPRKAKGEME